MFRNSLRAAACAALALGSSAAGAESLRYDLGEHGQSRASARPFRIGITGQIGTVPGPGDDGGHHVVVPSELHVGYTLGRNLTIGIGALSFAGADTVGDHRWSLGGGPFVEGFTFLGERFQPFAQVGVPLQVRWSSDDDSAVGVAPYASVGARYWLTDFFTLGASTRVSLVASNHWLVEDRVLPQLAVPWTAGIDADFHF